MKRLKFNVSASEVLSGKVQRMLFDSGYSWANGGTTVLMDKLYLYTEGGGRISWGSTETCFREEGHQEIDVSWMTPPEPPIKVGSDVCKFKDDGSVRVGCTNVDFDTIEAIYNKARKTKK